MCPPLPIDPELTPSLLDQMSPGTRALLERVQATAPLWVSDEFARIGERLGAVLVCTSLTDDEVTERVRQIPSGTSGGWAIDPDLAPAPCPNRPATHRHRILSAWIDASTWCRHSDHLSC